MFIQQVSRITTTKYRSFALLAFCGDSPHKCPVMWKPFPCHDITVAANMARNFFIQINDIGMNSGIQKYQLQIFKNMETEGWRQE